VSKAINQLQKTCLDPHSQPPEMGSSISSNYYTETIQMEQGKKPTLLFFLVQVANSDLTSPPIPTITDYWQKLFITYATWIQPKRELRNQKREDNLDGHCWYNEYPTRMRIILHKANILPGSNSALFFLPVATLPGATWL
jgi:hypothetical protein